MHENSKMKLNTKLGNLNVWNENLSEFNSNEKLMNLMNECYA